MQTAGTKSQLIFWRYLSGLIFKAFICDNAQADFDAICIVYGMGDLSIPMVDCKGVIYFTGK